MSRLSENSPRSDGAVDRVVSEHSTSDGHARGLATKQPRSVGSRLATFYQRQAQWVLLALLITATQVILAALAGNGPTWTYRYFSYFTWDAAWYMNVLTNGYSTTPVPNAAGQYNLAFFPAYPVAAGFVQRLFSLSPIHALFVTSQIAAVVFWWALLRMMASWRITPTIRLLVVMLVFSQPGAFYLVVPYSESVFLSGLVLLVWKGTVAHRSLGALIVAAAGGYIMSATRVVGAPLALLAVAWFFMRMPAGRDLLPRLRQLAAWIPRYAFLACAIAGGALSFFVYCAVKFEHWDQYMRARRIGWGANNVDVTGAFQPRNFGFSPPGFGEVLIAHNETSRLLVSTLLLLLIALPIADFVLTRLRLVAGIRVRFPFYLAAALLLAANLLGSTVALAHYIGFARYGLLTAVLLLLAVAHAHAHSVVRRRPIPLAVLIVLFLIAAICLAVQFQFAWGYTHGSLVA